ncbi:class I SAM-dependent methyltransferase [Clostridium sp.]|uniref:class I SAM-dependent methyltransferase n=1 Tax=Clostridium sp. TaxID=1506 RepID=UPI003D6CC1BE
MKSEISKHEKDAQGNKTLQSYITSLSMQVEKGSLGVGSVPYLIIVAERHGIPPIEQISEKMIDIAKKNLGNKAKLKVGDSECMPWANNTFDVIVCNASFHHYPNHKDTLLEVNRVLKSNGTLIIGDPTAPVVIRQMLNLYHKIGNTGDYKIYYEKEDVVV